MKQRGGRARRRCKAVHSGTRLMRTLAACDGNPGEMLELYYWSKEPGFRQIIRAIATMPETAKGALETFIALARDTKSVTADLDSCGVLTLYSAEAVRSAVLAQRAADEDTQAPAPLLN